MGNDNPARELTAARLGAESDPRIRIVNRPRNLGETGNMNALLSEARGRYFTWLADDDLYHADLLRSVAGAIEAEPGADCVFTLYRPVGPGSVTADEFESHARPAPRRLSGLEFLRRYLGRELRVIGCYGFFRRERLAAIGGMRRLSAGISPYSDNLLALQSARLSPVLIDAPLICYRIHEGSVSYASGDPADYRQAQAALWSAADNEVFNDPNVPAAERSRLRSALLRWFVDDYCAVLDRTQDLPRRELSAYLKFFRNTTIRLNLADAVLAYARATMTAGKTTFKRLTRTA